MDNEKNARVTRKEAALLAGVTERTINRWSAEGLLRPQYGGWREPATYDRGEVLRAAGRNADLAALANPETGGTVVS